MPEQNPTVGWHVGEPKTPTYDGFRFTNSRRLSAEVIDEADTAARKVANARLFRALRDRSPIFGGDRGVDLLKAIEQAITDNDDLPGLHAAYDFALAEHHLVTAQGLAAQEFERVKEEILRMASTPPKPIRLTQQQMDAIPRGAEDQFQRAPWFAYTGVPVERVEDVRESTPWIEGWIRCPYCRIPANRHPCITSSAGGCGALIGTRGQDVLVIPPPPTEVGRRALAVYRPDRFGSSM